MVMQNADCCYSINNALEIVGTVKSTIGKKSLRELFNGARSICLVYKPYITFSKKFNKKRFFSVNHTVTTEMVCRNIPVLVPRPYKIVMVPWGSPFLIQYAIFFEAPHW